MINRRVSSACVEGNYWSREMLWLITPLGKGIKMRIFLSSLMLLLMLSFFNMSLFWWTSRFFSKVMQLKFSIWESSSLFVLFFLFCFSIVHKKKKEREEKTIFQEKNNKYYNLGWQKWLMRNASNILFSIVTLYFIINWMKYYSIQLKRECLSECKKIECC